MFCCHNRGHGDHCCRHRHVCFKGCHSNTNRAISLTCVEQRLTCEVISAKSKRGAMTTIAKMPTLLTLFMAWCECYFHRSSYNFSSPQCGDSCNRIICIYMYKVKQKQAYIEKQDKPEKCVPSSYSWNNTWLKWKTTSCFMGILFKSIYRSWSIVG